MAVTTTPIGIGAAINDGTGDPARTAGSTLNANDAALDAAVEELQSGKWRELNTNSTINVGNKVICNSLGGPTVTFTLNTGATTLATDDFNDIWIFNNDDTYPVSIAPPLSPTTTIHYDGASYTVTSISLPPGKVAHLVQTATDYWDMNIMQSQDMSLNADLDDCVVGSEAEGDLLIYTSSKWRNRNAEECDLVERDTPAIEATPYIHHETLTARSSGTETIDCATQPSVYLPITGDNVTIDLDVPALSLPVRGLADVALRGYVMVYLDAAYTGLTVTTDAGTKLGTFPKGTAPSALGEYATLAWFWFDDGTTDFMWAAWLNDA